VKSKCSRRRDAGVEYILSLLCLQLSALSFSSRSGLVRDSLVESCGEPSDELGLSAQMSSPARKSGRLSPLATLSGVPLPALNAVFDPSRGLVRSITANYRAQRSISPLYHGSQTCDTSTSRPSTVDVLELGVDSTLPGDSDWAVGVSAPWLLFYQAPQQGFSVGEDE